MKLAQGASEIPYNNTNTNKYDATGYLQNASTYALQNYLDYNLVNKIYKMEERKQNFTKRLRNKKLSELSK